jgi:hypothetical protein
MRRSLPMPTRGPNPKNEGQHRNDAFEQRPASETSDCSHRPSVVAVGSNNGNPANIEQDEVAWRNEDSNYESECLNQSAIKVNRTS